MNTFHMIQMFNRSIKKHKVAQEATKAFVWPPYGAEIGRLEGWSPETEDRRMERVQ